MKKTEKKPAKKYGKQEVITLILIILITALLGFAAGYGIFVATHV